MTVPTCLGALHALKSHPPADAATQIAALKHVKTEIIGYFENKESLVKHGILQVLVRILETSVKSKGKRRSEALGSLQNGSGHTSLWAEEDEVTLQAILILGSFAHAGPSFVAPILASGAISPLLSILSPKRTPPRTLLAVLRALNSLADAARRTLPVSENLSKSFTNMLYAPEAVRSFANILAQRSPSSIVQSQVELVSRLLRRTCGIEESYQRALVRGGVLDLLAARIASFYANHESWTRWNEAKHGSSIAAELPPPSKQAFPEVLRAANNIVRLSIYRMMRLVSSPTVKRVFSLCPPESLSYHKSLSDAADYYCLPRVPQPQLPSRKSDHGRSRHFPALGSIQARGTGEALAAPAIEAPEESERAEGYLSSLITWLLVTIKEDNGPCRIAASLLFTTLTTSGLFGQYIDRMAAMIVAPRLIDVAFGPLNTFKKMIDGKDLSNLKADAIYVIAKLVEDRTPFQKAALDAGIIEKVCFMLKMTFEAIEVAPPSWSSRSASVQGLPNDASCRLGLAGIPEPLERIFYVRQRLLILVAMMAKDDDEYRKKLNEGGAVQHIMDSLRPLDERALQSPSIYEAPPKKTRLMPLEFGNPIDVLLAACAAGRSLSRSVSLLRTSLIDSGLAAPILALLKHPDVEVMKAATDVVCNLNPEFSPMRQDLIEAGAIKTLCDHARSADPEICIRSLWALKHLVHQLHNDIKLQCFEELGSGWLMRVIIGEQFEDYKQDFRHKPLSYSLGAANAAGEKVDILNATDDRMSDLYDDSDHPFAYNTVFKIEDDDLGATALSLLFPNDGIMPIPTSAREFLQNIRDTEKSRDELRSIDTEINIQRQGLDFLRNFIIGPGAAELIDTVFRSMGGGAEEIFKLITAKIRAHSPPEVLAVVRTSPNVNMQYWGPGSVQRNGTRSSGAAAAASAPPAPQINPLLLHSAIMTLTHIAAGNPNQRSMLLAQPALLNLLHAHLSHGEASIRVAVAWCINNLTWMDDGRDASGVIYRAGELKKAGFVETLRGMAEDANVDVRERVSTALTQLERALRDGEAGSAGVGTRGLGSPNATRGPGIEREGAMRAREGRLS